MTLLRIGSWCRAMSRNWGRVLRSRLAGNEFVLVKASRGVQLERVIPFLANENEV